MITTILAFVLTLGVLVTIHEYGHYRVALACGVKVLRFSVGFGRVLWRRQASPNSTEFVLSALPLGGYVRMLDEREGPVRPDELHLAFNRKPLWKRAAVVSAGPIANLLLAVLLYSGAHWIGIDEPKALIAAPPAGSIADQGGLRAGDWVRAASTDGENWNDVRSLTDLRWEVTQAVLHGARLSLMVADANGNARRNVELRLDQLTSREIDAQTMRNVGIGQPFRQPVIGEVKDASPASRGGLERGDSVKAVDDAPVTDASMLIDRIRASAADGTVKPMRWRVDRHGRSVDLQIEPAVVTEAGQRFGRIGAGIGDAPQMVLVRYGPIEGVTQAVKRTWEVSTLTLKMLGKMVIGQASLKNLSGPLTIADYAGQSVRLGLAYYLGFLAVVSVSLGVLNLLPLPMLDGGHLAYFAFEAVTGRPVSELWLERLQRGGVAIMLMMMSLALYNDVARLLGLH